MINISLRFTPPVEVLIFLLIAVISGLWAYALFKKNLAVSFVPVIVFNLVSLAVWAVWLGVAHDESEHLHLSWLVAQGLIPYRDFWQHHSPFLWIMAAPFFKWFHPSVAILGISRIFCGVVFAANFFLGWRIARKVWGGEARFVVYLLILSSVSLLAQFLLFRPDIFMLFFLLVGISISLEIPGRKYLPCFFAGLAFALAASFMVKQYFVFFLPVIAVFFGEKRTRFLKLILYFLGLALGSLPLLSYLISYKILQDYIFWVFSFNAQRVVFSVYLPVGIVFLSSWGAYLLFKRFRGSREAKFIILFLAVCLSTVSSLTMTSTVDGGYYLAFWFFICAIAASGCDLSGIFRKIPSLIKRSVVFGLLSSLFMGLTVTHLFLCKKPNYSTDRRTVSQLINYCADDACVTFLSAHPIFSQDAIRLYSFWQYFLAEEESPARKDVLLVPIAGQIIKTRPAVVICRYLRRDFLLDLFQKKLITAADYKELVAFFKENYTQEYIGKQKYYIRNDKIR